MFATFADWTRGRTIASLGTNAGSAALPFQSWRRFKEAFAPELVARAVRESRISVKRCLDPFGGSGTTALACQFLGIRPVTIEVNPFLADLIQAKLTRYDPDALARDFGLLLRRIARTQEDPTAILSRLPATFVEPGVKKRWLFDKAVAHRIAAVLGGIGAISSPDHRRLFTVLLGGTLIDVSNVTVSGKGRRYRRGWSQRVRDPRAIDTLFCQAVQRAITEIHCYSRRPCPSYELYRGDCRVVLEECSGCDLAVFSPPYPNSFDYTDVYNVELWMLGYLDNEGNRQLRRATLCSHVQISRDFPVPPEGSSRLNRVLRQLLSKREVLWDRRIPAMLGGYFSDVLAVLRLLKQRISRHGSVWMVVGDSRYADVQVETARIIIDLAVRDGWRFDILEACRSMRSSPQHGGRHELSENLLVLSKP